VELTAEKQGGQIRNQICRWNPDTFREALAGFQTSRIHAASPKGSPAVLRLGKVAALIVRGLQPPFLATAFSPLGGGEEPKSTLKRALPQPRLRIRPSNGRPGNPSGKPMNRAQSRSLFLARERGTWTCWAEDVESEQTGP
jgi:hypothetical protein